VKISYSALSTYIDCPYKYKLHYIDKLRPQTVGSALVFGNAIDKAVDTLLQSKDLNKAKQVFDKEFATTKGPLGNTIDTRSSSLIVYNLNDVDWDLISEDSSNPQWDSLSRKGHIILEGFDRHIVPKVIRVLAVQPNIELENEKGDKVIGKADLIVEWENGEIHAVDVKTSGMMYEKDSVQKSTQLAIYNAALKDKYKIDKCAYWVGLKNINKNKTKRCVKCGMDGSGTNYKNCHRGDGKNRCKGEWDITIRPTAYIQTVIDNVDPLFEQNTIANLNEVAYAVNERVFFRNYNNCIKPWGPCQFYKVCHSNSLDGLVKK
jgi:hypothetical protein